MSAKAFREREIHLSCQLASVTIGRHFVRDTLLAWDLERLVEDAELGVSELVANAVRYAQTEVTLTICVGDHATFSVVDRNPMLRRPVPRVPDDLLAESGRGLRIVAAVAADWGIEAQPRGKSIWFTLPLPDSSILDAEVHAFAQPSESRIEAPTDSRTAVVG